MKEKTDYKDAEVISIQLVKIVESESNPRKHYDEKGLNDLAESIRTKGIIQPLLVRPISPERDVLIKNGKEMEVVAGSRRYRAAKLLKLETVPCIIRNYTDGEVLEIQVIENNQREDVHPLEEGEGYASLLAMKDQNGAEIYTVEAIAGKIGRSDKYVRERLQLAKLIPQAKKALEENKIYYTHARLIARLKPDQQEEALRNALGQNHYTGRSFQNPVSVKELEFWISQNIEKSLSGASFPLDDALLVKSAGACNVCPKNTACDGQLFPDYATSKKGVCLDPKCFHAKIKAEAERKVATNLTKEGAEEVLLVTSRSYKDSKRKIKGVEREVIGGERWQKADKKTPGAKKAVIVGSWDMKEKGKEIYVTIGRKKSESMGSLLKGNTQETPEAKAKRENDEFIRMVTEIREFKEVIKKLKTTFTNDEFRNIADILSESRMLDIKIGAALLGTEPASIEEAEDYDVDYCYTGKQSTLNMQQIFKAIRLMIELPEYGDDRTIIKKYNIDVKKIEKQVRAEVAEKNKARELDELLVTFAGMKYGLKEADWFEPLKWISEALKEAEEKGLIKNNHYQFCEFSYRKDNKTGKYKFSEWQDKKDKTWLGFDKLGKKDFIKLLKGYGGKKKK